MRARQNINREPPVHQSRLAPGARTALRLYALPTWGQRRRRGRGSVARRPYATKRARQPAREANTPWQISRFVSGGGVIAARRSSNSSGSNVSSAGRRATPSSAPARCARRSAAVDAPARTAGARYSAQPFHARPIVPHTLACRSKPSRCACRGPLDVTVAVSRASPSRRTRAPARWPSDTRPCAPTIPASTGDSSASGSAPSRRRRSPARGVPRTAARGGGSSGVQHGRLSRSAWEGRCLTRRITAFVGPASHLDLLADAAGAALALAFVSPEVEG